MTAETRCPTCEAEGMDCRGEAACECPDFRCACWVERHAREDAALKGPRDETRAALEAFFEACVRECLDTPEFMAEYRRLYGSTLGLNTRSPIAQMVDRACGYDPHAAEYEPFFRFVRDCVWRPVLRKLAEEGR